MSILFNRRRLRSAVGASVWAAVFLTVAALSAACEDAPPPRQSMPPRVVMLPTATPEPTATPAPTPTPAPTATPVPTPTPEPTAAPTTPSGTAKPESAAAPAPAPRVAEADSEALRILRESIAAMVAAGSLRFEVDGEMTMETDASTMDAQVLFEGEAAAPTTPSGTAKPESAAAPAPAPRVAEADSEALRILRESIAAMVAAGSLRFEVDGEMTMETDASTMDAQVLFEGEAAAPDRMRGDLILNIGAVALQMGVISADGVLYTTNPMTGAWEVALDFGGAAIPNLAMLLAEGESPLIDAQVLGEETLDGVQVVKLRGEARIEGLEGDFPSADVWIGVEDRFVHRIASEGDVSLDSLGLGLSSAGLSGDAHIRLNMRLYGFGDSVDIEAPAVAP